MHSMLHSSILSSGHMALAVLSAVWLAHGLQEQASHSVFHLLMQLPVCSHAVSPGSTQLWPQQPHGPWPCRIHTGCGREPEMDSSWEEAKLPGQG